MKPGQGVQGRGARWPENEEIAPELNNLARWPPEVPPRHQIYRPCMFLTQLGDLRQKNVSARRDVRYSVR